MTRLAEIQDFPGGITAIDTHYVRPRMDASHLVVEDGRAAFVDTGANNAVPRLLGALEARGLAPEDVDWLLLTHVHLDHAGGAGELMARLPRATAVIHPRGAPHMADPGKLEAGTRAVYGDEEYDRLYGHLRPIPGSRIHESSDGETLSLAGRRLELIHTEGHARHHYCIVDHGARVVFAGDTFGLSYRELDTEKGEFIFPTTTPVHFDPDAAVASVDRIMGYGPEAVYLTHYSRVTDLDRLARDLKSDIREYACLAAEAVGEEEPEAWLRGRLWEQLFRRLDAHGVRQDAAWRDALLANDLDLNTQGLLVWARRRTELDDERKEAG